jgi:hypothetical protein
VGVRSRTEEHRKQGHEATRTQSPRKHNDAVLSEVFGFKVRRTTAHAFALAGMQLQHEQT